MAFTGFSLGIDILCQVQVSPVRDGIDVSGRKLPRYMSQPGARKRMIVGTSLSIYAGFVIIRISGRLRTRARAGNDSSRATGARGEQPWVRVFSAAVPVSDPHCESDYR